GGSEMGRAYMQAFVDLEADTSAGPLPYLPGRRTRLPNRYYRFRAGSVDFFALDSNTLDAPPARDAATMRAGAAERLAALQARAQSLDRRLRRAQLEIDGWRVKEREIAAADRARLQGFLGPAH